eukprot:6209115-Pleurochrysis_carterae.AAC.1
MEGLTQELPRVAVAQTERGGQLPSRATLKAKSLFMFSVLLPCIATGCFLLSAQCHQNSLPHAPVSATAFVAAASPEASMPSVVVFRLNAAVSFAPACPSLSRFRALQVLPCGHFFHYLCLRSWLEQ